MVAPFASRKKLRVAWDEDREIIQRADDGTLRRPPLTAGRDSRRRPSPDSSRRGMVVRANLASSILQSEGRRTALMIGNTIPEERGMGNAQRRDSTRQAGDA